ELQALHQAGELGVGQAQPGEGVGVEGERFVVEGRQLLLDQLGDRPGGLGQVHCYLEVRDVLRVGEAVGLGDVSVLLQPAVEDQVVVELDVQLVGEAFVNGQVGRVEGGRAVDGRADRLEQRRAQVVEVAGQRQVVHRHRGEHPVGPQVAA